MNRRRQVITAALLLGIATRRAMAQRVSSTLDISGASTRYADSINVSATTLSPSLLVQWTHASLSADGAYSRLGQGAQSVQARTTVALSRPFSDYTTGELSVAAGGSSHSDGARTTQVLGTARLYAGGANAGAWVGAGAGQMNDGLVSRSVIQGDISGWFSANAWSGVLSFTPTSVGDSIRYTDLSGSLGFADEHLQFVVSGGSRSGGGAAATAIGRSATWGSASLVAWVTPSIGVSAGGGSYPIDLTQGFPGGQFATIGIRLRWRGSSGADAPLTTQPEAADAGQPATFAFDRARIRVRVPAGRRVEVNGDFLHWEAAAMSSDGDGWWSLATPLPPGVHQVVIRINGGPWTVPPGLTPLKDEFGGVVGVLIVP